MVHKCHTWLFKRRRGRTQFDSADKSPKSVYQGVAKVRGLLIPTFIRKSPLAWLAGNLLSSGDGHLAWLALDLRSSRDHCVAWLAEDIISSSSFRVAGWDADMSAVLLRIGGGIPCRSAFLAEHWDQVCSHQHVRGALADVAIALHCPVSEVI